MTRLRLLSKLRQASTATNKDAARASSRLLSEISNSLYDGGRPLSGQRSFTSIHGFCSERNLKPNPPRSNILNYSPPCKIYEVATGRSPLCYSHRPLQTTTTIIVRHCRSYHKSTLLNHLVHKDAEIAKPTEEELAETEDTVPNWQNPLHHNNPEMQKMFGDDFEDGEEIPKIPLPPLEMDPDKAVAPPHIHELAHQIVHLNLLELKELTRKISEHFGFDDDMMAAQYGGGGPVAAAGADDDGSDAEAKEEKTVFDLKLVGFDKKAKIKVIKEVRSLAGLGLKEAKELVEGAPKIVTKDLKQDKADELKAKLEAVGAEVEIV